MGNRSAFFYGTLMAPEVLHRVCHGASNPAITAASNSRTTPAISHAHRRHRVRDADYPAVLPHPTSTVRGTYVTGLTDADIWRSDIFEGSEYSRQVVKVRLLTTVGDEDGTGNVEGAEVQAETYIWVAGTDRLEEQEWDFGEFQREKMRFWVGESAEKEFAEVDEAVEAQRRDGTGGRGSNGHVSGQLEGTRKKEREEAGNVVEPVKSAV